MYHSSRKLSTRSHPKCITHSLIVLGFSKRPVLNLQITDSGYIPGGRTSMIDRKVERL